MEQPLAAAQAVSRILLIRGRRVILDYDLAALYGVRTKALNQAVKRNAERFPPRFLFQLTAQERDEVVTNCDHLAKLRFSPTLPYAFTEHGALMAANVLSSARAVRASIFVVEAFIGLREELASHRELASKLLELERKLSGHDAQIRAIVETIRKIVEPVLAPRPGIGFKT